jgi:hypothetical protein
MSKKLITLLLLIFCWITQGYAAIPQHHRPTQSTPPLPLFSSLDVTGPVKVILTCAQPTQNVSITLPPSEVQKQLNIAVHNQRLVMDADPEKYGARATPLLIHIRMQQPLKSLRAAGSAQVYGSHCGNPNLVVIARDTASVQLQGKNTLYAAHNQGSSTIQISQITGKNLIVESGRGGKIILSGKVDALNARLGGTTLLDALHLRVRSAHVQTFDQATAYVSPWEVLYGFAQEDSNIYYPEYPQRVVKDSYASGNVLKLVY